MPKLYILLLIGFILTQCKIITINYLTKPRIKKIERLENCAPKGTYNFYQYFGNAFEAQPGENPESSIHIKFNYPDSTFNMSLEDHDSDKPFDYYYTGSYTVNESGFIQLSTPSSPFKDDQLQIVMWNGTGSQLVRFTFNDQFKKIFPRNSQTAFCEAEEFELENCVIR